MYRATYHYGINFPFILPIHMEVKNIPKSSKESYPFGLSKIFSSQGTYNIQINLRTNGNVIIVDLLKD